MGKYYWTRAEEAKLLELWKKGITDFNVLAKELNRKPLGVKRKLQRMGVVVGQKKIQRTTTTTIESRGLLTHEQAIKILAGAIEALRKSGQDKLELQRLRILVDAVQTYDSVLEKFEKWVEIEAQLLEMDKKITELEKAKGTVS
ncbi:MAG: hypothetical protein OEZ35_00060 [Candidatus Bathyarchaeota archaeon]|nr:hypothetical protein [Candidatus Bathyarchaeota archaeon]